MDGSGGQEVEHKEILILDQYGNMNDSFIYSNDSNRIVNHNN